MSKKGNCRNCKRDTSLVADALCGMCYNSTRGLLKDSPEYSAALASAKAKAEKWESIPGEKAITDMQTKRRGRKPKISVIPAAETQLEIVEGTAGNVYSRGEKPKAKNKDIITILEDRRHELMQEVTQINQTIEVIRRYQAKAA